MYIDDILALHSFSTCFCYADNTKLICSSEKIFFILQQDLDRLSQWCRDFSMMFNLNKCVFLHLSEKTTGSLFTDDYQLQRVDSICDLGLQVSKALEWEALIRGKLLKAPQNFNYHRHSEPYCLPSKVKFNLFSARVMSSFVYASPAWHVDATHLRLLEKFYWKGLCCCFGYSDFKSFLSLSESLPIACQLLIVIWSSSSALFKAKVVFPPLSISVVHDLTDVSAAAKQLISFSMHAPRS